MLTLSVLTLLSGVSLVLALTITEDGHYDTRYNHLDIERILNNKRLVTYYAQCLTGEGPCTPQGTEFKRILPEALRTNCVRCTAKQKHTAYLAIRRLKKEYPRIWQQLQAAWDPSGELVSTFINTVESAASRPATPGPGAAELADNEITREAPSQPVPRGMPTTRSASASTTDSYRTSERPTSGIPITRAIQSTTTITTTTTSRPTTTTTKPTITSTIKNVPLVISLNNEARQTASTRSITSTPQNEPFVPVVLSRGGPELPSTGIVINDSPTSDINNQPTQTTTTTVKTTTQNVQRIVPSSTRVNVQVTDTNYRNTYRPTRFNILLPRPHDIGRLTANVIGSIGDIGTKVIRTGARIADMVLTGVQAGVQATIGRIQQ